MHDIGNDLLLWLTIAGASIGILAAFHKPWNNWFEWRIHKIVEPMLSKNVKTAANYASESANSARRAERAADRADNSEKQALAAALEIKRRPPEE